MYEYKVLRFDLKGTNNLEQTLNDYAKEGWRVLDIITNIKGNGTILFSYVDGNEATIIMERIKSNYSQSM